MDTSGQYTYTVNCYDKYYIILYYICSALIFLMDGTQAPQERDAIVLSDIGDVIGFEQHDVYSEGIKHAHEWTTLDYLYLNYSNEK